MPHTTTPNRTEPSSLPGANNPHELEMALSQMSQLVVELEQAIRSSQSTERIWQQLRQCNVVLYAEAHRDRTRC